MSNQMCVYDQTSEALIKEKMKTHAGALAIDEVASIQKFKENMHTAWTNVLENEGYEGDIHILIIPESKDSQESIFGAVAIKPDMSLDEKITHHMNMMKAYLINEYSEAWMVTHPSEGNPS